MLIDDIWWAEPEVLNKYLEEDKSTSMRLGEALTRYALVKEGVKG